MAKFLYPSQLTPEGGGAGRGVALGAIPGIGAPVHLPGSFPGTAPAVAPWLTSRAVIDAIHKNGSGRVRTYGGKHAKASGKASHRDLALFPRGGLAVTSDAPAKPAIPSSNVSADGGEALFQTPPKPVLPLPQGHRANAIAAAAVSGHILVRQRKRRQSPNIVHGHSPVSSHDMPTEPPMNSYEDWGGSPGHVAELHELEAQRAPHRNDHDAEAVKRVLFVEESPPTQAAEPWEVCEPVPGVGPQPTTTSDAMLSPNVLEHQPTIDVVPTVVPSSNDMLVPAPQDHVELESHSASLPLTAPTHSSQPIASQLHPSPPELFPDGSVEMEVAWARTATQTTVPAVHVTNPVPLRPQHQPVAPTPSPVLTSRRVRSRVLKSPSIPSQPLTAAALLSGSRSVQPESSAYEEDTQDPVDDSPIPPATDDDDRPATLKEAVTELPPLPTQSAPSQTHVVVGPGTNPTQSQRITACKPKRTRELAAIADFLKPGCDPKEQYAVKEATLRAQVSGARLFSRIAFLLTGFAGTGTKSSILAAVRQCPALTCAEHDCGSPCEGKDALTELITAHGGVVCERLAEIAVRVSDGYECAVVSTPIAYRTLKYVYGVAVGVAPVDAQWVLDCISACKLLDRGAYRLAIGNVRGEGVVWHRGPQLCPSASVRSDVSETQAPLGLLSKVCAAAPPLPQSCLAGARVTVIGDDGDNLVSDWMMVLEASGATVSLARGPDTVARCNSRKRPRVQGAIIGVVSPNITPAAKDKLNSLGDVALVTVDWVIQSLVTAKLQDVAEFSAESLLVERGLVQPSRPVASGCTTTQLLRVKDAVFESGESVYYKACKHVSKPCKCGRVAVGKIVEFDTASPPASSVTVQCWQTVDGQHPPSCSDKCVWKLSNDHVDVSLDAVIGKCVVFPVCEAAGSMLPCRWSLLFSVET